MPLSRRSVGTSPETSSHATCQGTIGHSRLSSLSHCGNMRVERTLNKSQHTKSTLEKKILPSFLLGFELAIFLSRVRRSYQQAILVVAT